MLINDTIIRNTRPGPRPIRLFDGQGLFLLIQPNGGRWWRMRCFVDGREQLLSVGTYPEVSLKQARDRRHEIRSLVANGGNPAAQRKAERQSRGTTFELVAREWWGKRQHLWKGKYAEVILHRLEKNIFPYLGRHPIHKLVAADFLEPLERMEKRGILESAHKTKTICSQVVRYAVATRRADRDPLPDLRGALTPVKPKHYATIVDPREIGDLLRTIDGYRGSSRIVMRTTCELRTTMLSIFPTGVR